MTTFSSFMYGHYSLFYGVMKSSMHVYKPKYAWNTYKVETGC